MAKEVTPILTWPTSYSGLSPTGSMYGLLVTQGKCPALTDDQFKVGFPVNIIALVFGANYVERKELSEAKKIT